MYELPNLLTHSSDRTKEIAELTPKSVAHGKTFDGIETYAVAHAIDGDLSTESATNTDNGAGWLHLEFDGTYFIHKVVIYSQFYANWFHPSDWCTQSETNFMQCVDARNNVDVSVYQGEELQKSCGTLQLTYGLEQSEQIYTLVCNTEGKAVKLSKNVGAMAVVEVVVTGIGMIICSLFWCL